MATDPFSNYLFDDFSENALPAHVGSTNLDILKAFYIKNLIFSTKTAQKKPILVMIFGPTALLLVPLPLYPLHASQAGPRKTSQISVLLLQVASLSDFKSVSDIILMTS